MATDATTLHLGTGILEKGAEKMPPPEAKSGPRPDAGPRDSLAPGDLPPARRTAPPRTRTPSKGGPSMASRR
eukprot:875196-Heterocapsa_arctica.AAC.1